jgi:alanyl-tRNA synthetase
MDSRTIRKRFLDYFQRQGHSVVRSASLVPENDPTLYFVNAGMVPFKDVFTGEQTRDDSRAASSQKCLRVSGKHNDLEQVGRTPKHHTFFEMLGNFSFGDYFKKDAIRFAWEFLSAEVGLDPERMVATVFAGEDGVPADEEAYACWRDDVGLPEERIFRLGKEDNFWSMGDTGPCGPCSEIHLMADPSVSMADALAAGGPAEDERWVEVWNLVFMQFERKVKGGELTPLAKTGVDTGMGLERLVALKNGFTSTYDTDLIKPLILAVAEEAGVTYGDDPDKDVSLRVVADHARATAFCVADGVFPEKGHREYVLRRIMRRAIRHGKLLGFEEPFFDRACLAVVDQMGEDYPELRERRELIGKIVIAEETSFRRTLDRGLKTLEQAIDKAEQAGATALEVAFVGDLYATDGFPIDLTRLIAEERGLVVDEEAAQGWVAETHGAGESKVGDAAIDTVYKQLSEQLEATVFLGYEQEQATARVVALLVDGARRERISAEELAPAEGQDPPRVEVICDRTPFYARAGGQVGDRGTLTLGDASFEVSDTLKPGGTLSVHQGRLASGSLAIGDEPALSVDGERRQRIRLNHSATHLLHHALRTVLGPHVAQKGSEVAPGQLRFDFSHFQSMTNAELGEVERWVNAAIRANTPAQTELTSFDEARASGAMALFGEKYGDEVRMVRIGETVELCGGTHVQRAGEIGLLRVVSEEALALGVRRIVAITGADALEHDRRQEQQLREVAGRLKARPDQLGERVDKLLAQLKAQERELGELKKQLATGGGADMLSQAKEINGIKALITRVEASDPKVLREAGDTLRDRLGSGVLVLAGEHQGKATLLVMVSKDLTKRVHAGKLVKELATLVDGRGGGRPDMAQAGGSAPEKLDDALAKAEELLAAM